MGQQPNLELVGKGGIAGSEPGPPRPWSPNRAGEVRSPQDVPSGGPFGTTGPDAGYVLTLISGRDIPIPDDEHRADAVAVLAALASARAAHYGRGPTGSDVVVSEILLGYDPALPDDVAADLAEGRRRWVAGSAHHGARARRVVAAVRVDVLAADPDEIRRRLAGGERFIDP